MDGCHSSSLLRWLPPGPAVFGRREAAESCPGAGNRCRGWCAGLSPRLAASMALCNLQISMGEEMKPYAQSLDLLWAYISGKVTPPLYSASWRWGCLRSPRGSGFRCTGQANAVRVAAPVQSTAQSLPALSLGNAMGPLFTTPQTFPPCWSGRVSQSCCDSTFPLLFPCPSHAVLMALCLQPS